MSLLANEKMNKVVEEIITRCEDESNEAWFRTIEELGECIQAIAKMQRESVKNDPSKLKLATDHLIEEFCQAMYMLEYYRTIVGITEEQIDIHMAAKVKDLDKKLRKRGK